jgi:hypothetical protein
MRFCRECGSEIGEADRFCGFCGAASTMSGEGITPSSSLARQSAPPGHSMADIHAVVGSYSEKIKDPHIFFHPNIPPKKLQDALRRYAEDADPADVLVLVENGALGGAKEGAILTSTTLYCSGIQLGPPHKVDIGGISSCLVDYPDYHTRIQVNGAKLLVTSLPSKPAMRLFHEMLCKMAGIPARPAEAPAEGGSNTTWFPTQPGGVVMPRGSLTVIAHNGRVFEEVSWGQVSESTRQLLDNVLEDDDTPWLVTHTISRKGVFAATAESLIFAGEPHKGEHPRSLCRRYSVRDISDMMTRRVKLQDALVFTHAGEAVAIPCPWVFFYLGMAFPHATGGTFTTPEETERAWEECRVHRIEIGHFVSAQKETYTGHYSGVAASAKYARGGAYELVVRDRGKTNYQKTPCQLCGAELWTRVTAGLEHKIESADLCLFSSATGLISLDDRAASVFRGANSQVIFRHHKFLEDGE